MDESRRRDPRVDRSLRDAHSARSLTAAMTSHRNHGSRGLDLVDVHYPKAKRIHVVLDNYTTHSLAALYDIFDAAEARRIARRIQLHFVPKHASWLNMAE